MKKLLLLGLMLLGGIGVASAQEGVTVDGDKVTVKQRTAGELQKLISPEAQNRLRVLIVEGNINNDDIAFMRKLASRYKVVNAEGKSVDAWMDIDLSRAHLLGDAKVGYTSQQGTSLGKQSFRGCYLLRTIALPLSLKTIGDDCFASCTKLKNVSLPRGLTTLGERVFYGDSQLSDIFLPASVTSIGKGCFTNCSQLKQLPLPPGLTVLPEEVFSRTGLSQIDIPARVQEIGKNAFSSTKISQISISAAVRQLAPSAFNLCSSLASIDVDANNPAYCSVDGVLYDKAKTTLLCCPNAKKGELFLPESVTAIGPGACSGCHFLSAIHLSERVTSIGSLAFCACSNLTSLQLPQSLTRLEYGLFSSCSSLAEIVLPPHVQELEGHVFSGCKALRSVTLPEGLTKIGAEAFQGCSTLTTLQLPSTLTQIGDEAFRKCTALTYLALPSSVTILGDKVVYDCKQLQQLLCFWFTPPTVKNVTNEKTPELVVPIGTKTAYAKAKGWSKFKKIKERDD